MPWVRVHKSEVSSRDQGRFTSVPNIVRFLRRRQIVWFFSRIKLLVLVAVALLLLGLVGGCSPGPNVWRVPAPTPTLQTEASK